MQQAEATTNGIECVKVLSVSPFEDDHVCLQTIIGHSRWTLFKADNYTVAQRILRQHDISVVLCERDAKPGEWTDLLDFVNDRSQRPSVIVASRLADERLWAEALNLGAWDVLGKPFDRNEVLRSVKAAWQHWHNQIAVHVGTLKAMRAAS